MRPLLLFCTTLALIVMIGQADAGGRLIKKEDVPGAIAKLKSSSVADRADAADKLGHRGAVRAGDVKEALEPLRLAAKNDPDPRVRSAAVSALGRIAAELDETVPVLTAALDDKAVAVKMAAIQALGEIGPEARAAAPKLREIAGAKDKDKNLARNAGMALKSIGGKKK